MGGSVRSAIVLSGSLAMIGSVLPRYCHSCSAISRGYRRNVLKGTAPVAVQANRSKGTVTVAVRYREDAPERPGQLIPKKAQKLRASRTPRASSRDWREHKYTLNIQN